MTQETASRSLDKIIVRLPDGMRDRLKEAADQNNRSVNAEVVARLEHSFSGIEEELSQAVLKTTVNAKAQKDALHEVIGMLSGIIMELGGNHPEIPKILANSIRSLKDKDPTDK
ncbi:Arc family DNA-binding protein [Agrobacterium sp. S2]|nr:Arc family DNA-binding protein [Agrobacterium sp. S2]